MIRPADVTGGSRSANWRVGEPWQGEEGWGRLDTPRQAGPLDVGESTRFGELRAVELRMGVGG